MIYYVVAQIVLKSDIIIFSHEEHIELIFQFTTSSSLQSDYANIFNSINENETIYHLCT